MSRSDESVVGMLEEEYEELLHAKALLEKPSFAIKAANYIGRPVEIAIEKIDSNLVKKATDKALMKALSVAIGSLEKERLKPSSNTMHKVLVGGSGAVGGFFGLPALAVELPVSTVLMLRSIADIAQSQGHDLNDPATAFACLEVFSLGSDRTHSDDAAESAYYSARAALAVQMRMALKAVEKMSTKAIQDALNRGQMPVLVKFIHAVAARFGVTVSEKLVAQTVPVLGAAGGAGINLMFIQHFQDMAEGHFVVKRLEKKYGEAFIRETYNGLSL
ncbi:MAG: EcsC family protein [Sulfurovum sp.]|nr:EcsC family protein [Sulfurovum sp.]